MTYEFREPRIPADENRRRLGRIRLGSWEMEVSERDGIVRISAEANDGRRHFVTLPVDRISELTGLLNQATLLRQPQRADQGGNHE